MGGSKPKYQGKEYRLNKKEREFAEKNHNLIFGYLRLAKEDAEEYYDVAAMGYVIAVIKYHRKPELKKYRFSVICYKAMACEINNERNRRNKCRDHECLLLDKSNNSESSHDSYGDQIPDPQDYFRQIEDQEDMRELLMRIMPTLTELQREHLLMKIEGYKMHEILKRQKIPFVDYRENERQIKEVVLSVTGNQGSVLMKS